MPSALDLSEVIRRWPTPRSKTWTMNLLEEASANDNIVAIVAVGSAVRPAVPSVDLDLVIICRAPVTLKAKPPLEIDLRMYEAAHVDDQIARGNDLLGWAVKFGRVLFQRDRYWKAIVESWRDRLPLPAPDVAARRADDACRRLTNVLDIGDIDAAHEQALSYVTHLARTELLNRNVYPASRPELPAQLRTVGCHELAGSLEQLMNPTLDHAKQITELVESRRLTSGCIRRRRSARRGNPKRHIGGRRG